jgi:hypothetical protein
MKTEMMFSQSGFCKGKERKNSGKLQGQSGCFLTFYLFKVGVVRIAVFVIIADQLVTGTISRPPGMVKPLRKFFTL